MTLKQQIKFHLDNKNCCKVKRQIAENDFAYSTGYIVDSSKDFIVMQEEYDFMILGYLVFPISTIKQIRFNNNDKYHTKIMQWEKETDKVSKKHDIDLSDWATIFRTIKKAGFNVIAQNEDEDPENERFLIGPITKITKTAVHIQYFNAKGQLDDEPTKITFDEITIAKFDDPYVNVFSKYLRKRKPQKDK